MPTLRRAAATRIQEALADTPVVVLNGARQVGKTPWRSLFVTLDDTASRESAELDPRAFVDRPHMAALPVSSLWS